jgi:hypothetical protein
MKASRASRDRARVENWTKSALSLALLVLLQACQTARVATNRCYVEYVTATATIDVAGSATTPSQIAMQGEGARVGEPGREALLYALLGVGAAADTGITWALVSAEGARLVMTQPARVVAGQRLTIAGPPARRDWGANASPATGTGSVAIELPGRSAARLGGTAELLRVAPLELRLELRTEGGETTVSGPVRFRRATQERPCFS